MPREKWPEIFAVPWKPSRSSAVCSAIVTQSDLCVYRPSRIGFSLSGFRLYTRKSKADRLKPFLLFRGVRLGRFSRAVQNVRVDQSNLRGGHIAHERRHAEFTSRAAQHNFLKHLVRGLRQIAQVRHRSSADGF